MPREAGVSLLGRGPEAQGDLAPPGDEPLWGDDIPIDTGLGRVASWDEDEATGELYVIVDQTNLTGPADTSLIYRSRDGGQTWVVWGRLVNSDGPITVIEIRLAKDGSGQTWVCVIGIWGEPEPGWHFELWMARKLASGGNWIWSMVHDDVEWDDSQSTDADADVGDGASVYVVYRPDNTENDIWAARHTLSGGWQDNHLLFANPQEFPYAQIAAGADGNVTVAFVDSRLTTNPEVRVKRSTNGGVTWLPSQQVSNNSGGFPLRFTHIASSHGRTQTGWISVSYQVDPLYIFNLGFYYSTDSGVTWGYGGLIGWSPDDEWEGSLRARKADSRVALAYNAGYYNSGECDRDDSLMVSHASPSDPSGFSTPERVNDADRGATHHAAGWLTRGGVGWPGAVFSSWVGCMDSTAYLDWAGNGTVFLVVEPDATVIPRGGTLGMTVYATNATGVAQPVEFWTNVTLPNGNTWPADETLVGPVGGNIPAGATASGRITHQVPADAPLNTFTYNALLGPAFPTVWTSDSFSFTTVASGDLALVSDRARARDDARRASADGEGPVSFPLIENTLFADGSAETASLLEGGAQHGAQAATDLLGASPNPFNPSTRISFRIGPSEAGEGDGEVERPVRLRVYNLRGELVRTLVEASVTTGSHSVTWDGRDERGNACGAGLYFLSLRAGSHTLTRKLVLAQ